MTFDLAEYEARLEPWSDIQGHLPFLKETAESCAKPVIIELGIRSGQSTSAFLAGIQGNGGHLWSVDVDEPQVPAHWRDLPEWHLLVADDVGGQAREWLPRECDVLFIDTSHACGHTLEELGLHVPRVRSGGMVLLHDTCWDEGDVELDEPTGPVARAVDQFCRESGLKWENRPGSYGMAVIRL